MNYINEYDRMKAEIALLSSILSAEKRAEKEGWISSDEAKRRLGVD